MQKAVSDANTSRVPPFWRGHLLLFDAPKAKTYTAQQGFKLLLVFLFVEILLRPLVLVGCQWLKITDNYGWLIVNISLLMILAYLLVRIYVKMDASQIGLYAWRHWTKTEKLYFLQIVPITIIVFSFFTSAQLKVLFARPNFLGICLFSLVPQIMWGFYQEFLYRGMLQTELVRRWGTWRGIIVSNAVFTFGPLHDYHFLMAAKNPAHLWIFVAIFGIGLFFSLIFKASGNLWLIGIMHGLGNLFLNGLTKI